LHRLQTRSATALLTETVEMPATSDIAIVSFVDSRMISLRFAKFR
jgi:hypothetical protein